MGYQYSITLKQLILFVACVCILFQYATLYFTNLNLKSPTPDSKELPIVFVYTVHENVCKSHGLPSYIKNSIRQAVYSQPDSEIVFASNFRDCPNIEIAVGRLDRVSMIDTSVDISKRTMKFKNMSSAIFPSDHTGELYITSALRFFHLEDIMRKRKYSQLLHVEADNLLYMPIINAISDLRTAYPTLAATPATRKGDYITASVLWVANVEALRVLTDFLLELVQRGSLWESYLQWMRTATTNKIREGHVKAVYVRDGMGVKPFSINEMTMLAYFRHLDNSSLYNFPVIPHSLRSSYAWLTWPVPTNTKLELLEHMNRADGVGLWDPSSWGQFLGGTPSRQGKDVGVISPGHIVGVALEHYKCSVHMNCTNIFSHINQYLPRQSSSMLCYTVPVVMCSGSSAMPLWNLHVHSKKTELYTSIACECESGKLQHNISTL